MSKILTSVLVSMFLAMPTILACEVHDSLPDSQCTPGDTVKVTVAQLCKAGGYTGAVRNVPESVKRQVYSSYGIKKHTRGTYEVDHLIPLSLGGSNDITNLWPQGSMPYPGFHQKDGLENRLRAMVCRGDMDLETAQIQISSDWVYFWTMQGKPADNAGVVTNVEGQP